MKVRETPIRQFDDLDRELIDSLVRILATLLDIKEQVTVADKKQMLQLYYIHLTKKELRKESADLDYIYGSAYPEDRVIYLNPRLLKRSYQALIETIIHELLHVKYPKAKESRIQHLEHTLTGRYDYTISSKAKGLSGGHFRVCKVIK